MPSIHGNSHAAPSPATFLKWTAAIFLGLVVFTVAFGLSPLGVAELNNWFFSLFIHDARDSASVSPSVVVSSSGTSGTIAGSNEAEVKPVSSAVPSSLDRSAPGFPTRITVAKTGFSVRILNPDTTDLDLLNQALLYGAVRYPGSGTLDSDRNILIFGHSSNLPVVRNQNYKAFLFIKTLTQGDIVYLENGTTRSAYAVDSVKLTNAENEVVTFSDDHQLILSTCNTLGAHEDRYVARLHFVGSYPLAS